jgi:pyruvate formate lyase activating enzyme
MGSDRQSRVLAPADGIDLAVEGTVFDLKRFAVHDGPGVRTVVFLKGCPLACAWCHNPESVSPPPELALYPQRCIGCGACVEACPNGAHSFTLDGTHVLARERCVVCGRCAEACYAEALTLIGKAMSVGAVLDVLVEDRSFYESSGGGVTLSGGEPFAQPAFTLALLRTCRSARLHTALDTSGYAPWPIIERALPFVDLVLFDVKHLNSEEHRRWTGRDNDLILANLRRIAQAGAPVEIRVPIVPGANDGDEHLVAVADLASTLPSLVGVRLLGYHSLAGSKYASIGRASTLPAVESPSREVLEALADRFRQRCGVPVTVGA